MTNIALTGIRIPIPSNRAALDRMATGIRRRNR